jgi:putative SOS response-associated peptidase YedK
MPQMLADPRFQHEQYVEIDVTPRALFRVVNRYVGNLTPMPGVFPDYPAPVVRNAGTKRELFLMRWGMPPPLRTGGPPVTNIRNVPSELRAAGTLTKKST